MLQVLLQAGATPHPNEEAPLITAVMQPVPSAVLCLLLAHGTDVNQQRSDHTPAIVIAARRGDHAAIDVLLRAGADVNARDQQGRTALMHAIERNEQRVVATLLLAGAAIDTVSADGTTALDLARGWRRQSVQFMLGEHHAGLDNVPITRTAVRTLPTGVRLCGDPPMLYLLASVIDIVLDDLGDTEWETRTGTDPWPLSMAGSTLSTTATLACTWTSVVLRMAASSTTKPSNEPSGTSPAWNAPSSSHSRPNTES